MQHLQNLPILWQIKGLPLPPDHNNALAAAKKSPLKYGKLARDYILLVQRAIERHCERHGPLPRHEGAYYLVFRFTLRHMRQDLDNIAYVKHLSDSFTQIAQGQTEPLFVQDSPRYKLGEAYYFQVVRGEAPGHVEVTAFNCGDPLKSGKLLQDHPFVANQNQQVEALLGPWPKDETDFCLVTPIKKRKSRATRSSPKRKTPARYRRKRST